MEQAHFSTDLSDAGKVGGTFADNIKDVYNYTYMLYTPPVEVKSEKQECCDDLWQ